jgi:O-antigen/teichoic acid export membrane protein
MMKITETSKIRTANSKVSLTEQTAGGIAWLFSGTGAQMVLKIAVLMVLARLVTPKEFGIVSASMVVISFALIIGRLGVGPALVQRRELTDAHIKAGFISSLGITFTAGILIYLGAPWFAGMFQMAELARVVAVLSFVFPITGLGLVSEALLEREMRFRVIAKIELLSYAVGYGLFGIVLAGLGWGVWALVGAQLGQVSLETCMLILARRHPTGRSAGLTAYRDLYSFGAGFSLANLAQFGAYQADNFVVGRWLGADALGIYSRAFQVLTMPTKLFGRAAANVLFPAMSTVQNDQERLRRGFSIACSSIVMLSLPLSMVVIILAPEIVWFVLGPQWSAVVLPLQILAASIAFRLGNKICSTLAEAKGAVFQLAWRQTFYAGGVFIGAWTGHFAGLWGVAIGVMLAIVLSFLLMFHLAARLSEASWASLGWPWVRHGFVSLILGIILFVLVEILRAKMFHRTIILATGCTVGAVLMLLFYLIAPSLFGAEGRMIVSHILKRIQLSCDKVRTSCF